MPRQTAAVNSSKSCGVVTRQKPSLVMISLSLSLSLSLSAAQLNTTRLKYISSSSGHHEEHQTPQPFPFCCSQVGTKPSHNKCAQLYSIFLINGSEELESSLGSRSIQRPTQECSKKERFTKDPQDQEESAHGRRRRRSLTQLNGNPIMQEIIRSMHAHEN